MGFTCKILQIKGLLAIVATSLLCLKTGSIYVLLPFLNRDLKFKQGSPGDSPGLHLLVLFHYSGPGITNTPREFSELAQVFVVLGLDRFDLLGERCSENRQQHCNSRSPSGMTTRKTNATTQKRNAGFSPPRGSRSGGENREVKMTRFDRSDRARRRQSKSRLGDDGELEGGADGDFVWVGDVVGFCDLRVFVGGGVEEQADG
jgi:hypothetical protein